MSTTTRVILPLRPASPIPSAEVFTSYCCIAARLFRLHRPIRLFTSLSTCWLPANGSSRAF